MSRWVRARIEKRRVECNKPMPNNVRIWLERIGGNPDPSPDAEAPNDVREWLNKTIEDPDWG